VVRQVVGQRSDGAWPGAQLDWLSQVAGQQIPTEAVPLGDQGDGLPAPAHAPGPANAMREHLGRFGQLDVDDQIHPDEVEPAGGDVGRHEDVDPAFPERSHDEVALLLGHVALQRADRVAIAVQLLRQRGDALLGSAEDDRHPGAAMIEQVAKGPVLGPHVGVVPRTEGPRPTSRRRSSPRDDEGDMWHGGRDPVANVDRDGLRVIEIPVRSLADPVRHRRREQCRLAAVRRPIHDPFDILGEPLVEHLVGLVEDDEPRLVQPQGALADQVEDSAGCADDDLGPAPQGRPLRARSRPAIDQCHTDAARCAELRDHRGDL
jgi:hypothetical protein